MKFAKITLIPAAFADLLSINRAMNNLNFNRSTDKNLMLSPEEDRLFQNIFAFDIAIHREYERFLIQKQAQNSFKKQKNLNFRRYHNQT